MWRAFLEWNKLWIVDYLFNIVYETSYNYPIDVVIIVHDYIIEFDKENEVDVPLWFYTLWEEDS